MRQRESRVTLCASVGALLGVVLMMGAAASAGHLTGNLLALAMTGLMALMMVIIRRNRQVSMLPASCLSACACAALALPFSDPVPRTGWTFLLLLLFGVQFGIGLLLLTMGSRRVSATRAALLANLELPLAPIWVWLAFGQVPPLMTCIGGGIVIAAIATDMAAGGGR